MVASSIVTYLLGHPRHLGVHSAGVLACPGPVTGFVPLFAAPGERASSTTRRTKPAALRQPRASDPQDP